MALTWILWVVIALLSALVLWLCRLMIESQAQDHQAIEWWKCATNRTWEIVHKAREERDEAAAKANTLQSMCMRLDAELRSEIARRDVWQHALQQEEKEVARLRRRTHQIQADESKVNGKLKRQVRRQHETMAQHADEVSKLRQRLSESSAALGRRYDQVIEATDAAAVWRLTALALRQKLGNIMSAAMEPTAAAVAAVKKADAVAASTALVELCKTAAKSIRRDGQWWLKAAVSKTQEIKDRG